MADWDKEMKVSEVIKFEQWVLIHHTAHTCIHVLQQKYLFEHKVTANDRTKTLEEIAKEEAEWLHALKTRHLAWMNGDLMKMSFRMYQMMTQKGKRKERSQKRK
jgi:hypothetical protein